MKKLNLNNLEWQERKSPKGRFHIHYRNVAAEFRRRGTGPKLPGEQPFEVAMIRVAPGTANFPFHSHAADWEFYLIVAGKGVMRAGKKRTPIQTGDCLLNPPGEPHQIINTGRTDLTYYVVANNSPTDFWHYPDSKKFGSASLRKFFRLQEVSYWDGEE